MKIKNKKIFYFSVLLITIIIIIYNSYDFLIKYKINKIIDNSVVSFLNKDIKKLMRHVSNTYSDNRYKTKIELQKELTNISDRLNVKDVKIIKKEFEQITDNNVIVNIKIMVEFKTEFYGIIKSIDNFRLNFINQNSKWKLVNTKNSKEKF